MLNLKKNQFLNVKIIRNIVIFKKTIFYVLKLSEKISVNQEYYFLYKLIILKSLHFYRITIS